MNRRNFVAAVIGSLAALVAAFIPFLRRRHADVFVDRGCNYLETDRRLEEPTYLQLESLPPMMITKSTRRPEFEVDWINCYFDNCVTWPGIQS